jgi:hypothetical protein
LGASSGGEVVVTAGLTAGTRIAVGDLARLEDGTKIRIEP